MTTRHTATRRTVLSALAAVTAATVMPAAWADALATLKTAGVLKVAVPQDFPPFGSAGTDLKPQGYDIDMANAIGKALGVKVELVPVTSANRIPFLQTKKVDLIISSLGKNPEREMQIDFSAAYAPFFSGVFSAADQPIKEMKDLAGKTVAVTKGALEDLELTKVAPADAKITRYADNNATISAYLAGQAQVVVTGNVVAAAINDKKPQRRLETKFVMKDSPCFIGVGKGEANLLKAVNDIVANMKKNGELDAISNKWLHQPLPASLKG
jgi:polar amino acid transport system substrate-binding protein